MKLSVVPPIFFSFFSRIVNIVIPWFCIAKSLLRLIIAWLEEIGFVPFFHVFHVHFVTLKTANYFTVVMQNMIEIQLPIQFNGDRSLISTIQAKSGKTVGKVEVLQIGQK